MSFNLFFMISSSFCCDVGLYGLGIVVCFSSPCCNVYLCVGNLNGKHIQSDKDNKSNL